MNLILSSIWVVVQIVIGWSIAVAIFLAIRESIKDAKELKKLKKHVGQ